MATKAEQYPSAEERNEGNMQGSRTKTARRSRKSKVSAPLQRKRTGRGSSSMGGISTGYGAASRRGSGASSTDEARVAKQSLAKLGPKNGRKSSTRRTTRKTTGRKSGGQASMRAGRTKASRGRGKTGRKSTRSRMRSR